MRANHQPEPLDGLNKVFLCVPLGCRVFTLLLMMDLVSIILSHISRLSISPPQSLFIPQSCVFCHQWTSVCPSLPSSCLAWLLTPPSGSGTPTAASAAAEAAAPVPAASCGGGGDEHNFLLVYRGGGGGGSEGRGRGIGARGLGGSEGARERDMSRL